MHAIEVIRSVVLLAYLGWVAISDLRWHSVAKWQISVGIIMMVVCYVILPFAPSSLFIGLLTGFCVLFLAFCSREAIGLGDGLILVIIGLGIGSATLVIFFYSLLIVSAIAFWLLVIKKAPKTVEIPLIPCYFLAYCIHFCYVQTTI